MGSGDAYSALIAALITTAAKPPPLLPMISMRKFAMHRFGEAQESAGKCGEVGEVWGSMGKFGEVRMLTLH